MLIQQRGNSLMLYKQHDHGLLSGELAHHWRGLSNKPDEMGQNLRIATALHDLSWFGADALPRCNPVSGRPYDFIEYPPDERVALYRAGINDMERVSPYVAWLISRHYCAFAGMLAEASFQASETKRREKLEKQLGLGSVEKEKAEIDLQFLQLFDVLSLYLCLASPEGDPESVPTWLDPTRFGQSPTGGSFALTWQGNDELRFDPFPFDQPFWVSINARLLSAEPSRDVDVWRRRWNEAGPQTTRFRLSAA